MHFLNLNALVVTSVILILSLLVITVSKPSPPTCVAKSQKVYSSLPENFELVILTANKIDLQLSNPLQSYDRYDGENQYIKVLIIDLANLAGSIFSLKNKKTQCVW